MSAWLWWIIVPGVFAIYFIAVRAFRRAVEGGVAITQEELEGREARDRLDHKMVHELTPAEYRLRYGRDLDVIYARTTWQEQERTRKARREQERERKRRQKQRRKLKGGRS